MSNLLIRRHTSQLKTLINLFAVRGQATTTVPPEHYDIIIGGGGLVGTALATAVAKNQTLNDKKILLIESAPEFKGFDINSQYGNRVSAINNNSIELFKSIGAWDVMKEARVKSVKQMQVWDASSDAQIQFNHEHFANDIACIIENDLMLHAIYGQLRDTSVKVFNNARIQSVNMSTDMVEVGLQDGRCYTCDLIVGADGANSLVRKAMNVDVFSINYERMGLVATLELHDAGDNSVAWQRFIPSGPVAMLPLNDKMSSLVWSTTIPHAKQLLQMSETEFVDALNEAFCKQFPKNQLADRAVMALNSLLGISQQQHKQYPPRVSGVVEKSRATFPLGFLHAASYISSGAALIGDAAHRIHPLAGQGVNLGFSDVRFLVETLAEAAYAGNILGSKQYLLKYEQKCLAKNVPIMIGVHGLQTIYSTSFSPAVLLRSMGLQLTHNMPAVKNMFMKRAMG